LELVYLWVEDYKNIKKQGFNFSPRFHCAYDEESNELTIDENDDYIPDFFGDNINVTAIVGKNGSGKSSLLEYLSDSPKFVVTFEDNQFFINQGIKMNNRTGYHYIYKNDFFLNKHIFNINIPYMEGTDLVPQYPTYSFQDQALMFLTSIHRLNEIIFPKKIFYSFDYDLLPYRDTLIISKRHEKFLEDKQSIHPLCRESVIQNMTLSEVIYIILLGDTIKYSTKEDDKSFLSSFLKKYKYIQTTKELFLELRKEFQEQEDIEIYEEAYNYAQLFQVYTNVFLEKELLEERKEDGFRKKIRGELLYYIPFNDNENIKNILGQIDRFEGHYFRWNIKLSTGELALINLLSEIFHHLKKSDDIKYLCLDEYETFLHPNWQKKYLSYIIQFLKDNFSNRRIHIILTSHSPFLLSDIPKQNIIFLDKDENGNCIVVNGLKEKKTNLRSKHPHPIK